MKKKYFYKIKLFVISWVQIICIMGKIAKNNHKKKFLKEGFKGGVSKHHKKYLGTNVPEGYFVKSKISILEKTSKEIKIESSKGTEKQLVFWIQPHFKYIAAASLIFILSLTVWLQNKNVDILKVNNIELFSFTDEVLINSLWVDDADLESFSDVIIINEILIKVVLFEQKIDDLFLNSLFLEDSLIDDYTNDSFIETFIL